jgi:hypothetical protein
VAEAGGEVRSLGVVPNSAESVSRLIKKLGKPEQLRVCYEAGPTGEGVHLDNPSPNLIREPSQARSVGRRGIGPSTARFESSSPRRISVSRSWSERPLQVGLDRILKVKSGQG